MLDPWIIEQIRRREEDERSRREQRPTVDMPQYPNPHGYDRRPRSDSGEDDDGDRHRDRDRDQPSDRGVTIINFSI